MSVLKSIFFYPAFAAISCITLAQEATSDTISIDEIVVTGTQVGVLKTQIPVSITTVDSGAIATSGRSSLLSAISGRVPGLFVTQRGVAGYGVAGGAAGQISVRGLGGSPNTQVLVLVNGHPQFMGLMGHPLPDTYVSADADRVEVIRGPASILYGSNALGGVVNIITRQQEQEGVHGHGHFSYGSYNSQAYTGQIGYRKKGFSTLVSVNHDNTDGHRGDSSYFRITNGYINTSYEFNNHIKADAYFSYARFEAADPGFDSIAAGLETAQRGRRGAVANIDRGFGGLTLTNNWKRTQGKISIFYNFGEHEISDGFRSNDLAWGVNAFQALKLFEGNTLTLGVDNSYFGGKAENVKVNRLFGDTLLSESGVYLMAQQSLFKIMNITAGIRYNTHSLYGQEWVPQAGLTIHPFTYITFKLSASEGYRSPTIRELYLNIPPNIKSNSALNPERIWNYDASVSFRYSIFELDVTGFYLEGDNLVRVVSEPVTGLTYANSGPVENKGIEAALSIKPFEFLSIASTYTYIDMKNKVTGTPEQHGLAEARFAKGKWGAFANVQWVNNLYLVTGRQTVRETYTLVGGGVNFEPLHFVRFYITADNIFGEPYSINYGYTMPGMIVRGGMILKF